MMCQILQKMPKTNRIGRVRTIKDDAQDSGLSDWENGRSHHRRKGTKVDKQILLKNVMNLAQVILGYVEL